MTPTTTTPTTASQPASLTPAGTLTPIPRPRPPRGHPARRRARPPRQRCWGLVSQTPDLRAWSPRQRRRSSAEPPPARRRLPSRQSHGTGLDGGHTTRSRRHVPPPEAAVAKKKPAPTKQNRATAFRVSSTILGRASRRRSVDRGSRSVFQASIMTGRPQPHVRLWPAGSFCSHAQAATEAVIPTRHSRAASPTDCGGS